MTREEAKRRIECCRDFLANNYSDMGEPNFTAFNMAIEDLSAEPCEDCISRAEAIKAMEDKAKGLKNLDTINGLCGAVAILYDLPSIQPKTDVLDKIRAEIADLDDADYDYEGYYKAVTDALKIIDKYKAESEDKE